MAETKKVYGSWLSPFTARVMIQVQAKGLDIPLVDPPGGIHSERYRALTPIDKIPTLDTGTTVLPESEVICEYLETCHPEPSLLDDDPERAARIRLVARLFDLYVMNAMLPLFGQLDPASRDDAVVARAVEAVGKGLDWCDQYLEGERYALFDRITLADAMAAPVLLFATTFLPMFATRAPLEGRPRLEAYWRGIQQDDLVAEVLEAMRGAIAAAS